MHEGNVLPCLALPQALQSTLPRVAAGKSAPGASTCVLINCMMQLQWTLSCCDMSGWAHVEPELPEALTDLGRQNLALSCSPSAGALAAVLPQAAWVSSTQQMQCPAPQHTAPDRSAPVDSLNAQVKPQRSMPGLAHACVQACCPM